MKEYIVKQGDCISSIAAKYGFYWRTLWEHSANAELLKSRKDNPNVIYPGDVVKIPDKEKRVENGETEKRHRFRLKGVPTYLNIRLLDNDEPISGERYVMIVGNTFIEDNTDGEGRLSQAIPANVKDGKLLLPDRNIEYPLFLGALDPIDKVEGVQERLKNLGHDCGEVDGVFGSRTRAALKEFQRKNRKKHNIEETGELDDATRKALKDEYES